MDKARPGDVGFSTERLGRIGDVLCSYVDAGKLAGAMALVARHGRIAYWDCFGQRDVEADASIEADTIFRIYSMTKPITSVAAMMLHEQGYFLLDDPIAVYLPELGDLQVYKGATGAGLKLVPAKSPITIRQLLTHTAGFSYGIYDEGPLDDLYMKADLLRADDTLEGMIKRLGKLPLAFHPGTAWTYSVATDVLARLVEVVSGRDFATYLQDEILGPLGMVDTGFYVPPEKADRFAALYQPSATGGIEPAQDVRLRTFLEPPALYSGGGGLVSTAGDYFKFCQMLLNGGEYDGVRLLGRKTVDFMRINHLSDEMLPLSTGEDLLGGYGFGLGFGVIVDVRDSGAMGSDGIYTWGGLASTHFWIDPVEDLFAILMTQLVPSGHYPIHLQFRNATYQALVN